MPKRKSIEKTPKLVDHISDSSDEEIDDDLAFNSDDERQYGAVFRKSKKTGRQDDNDEDDIGSDDSSEKSYDDDVSEGIASDDDIEGGDGGQYMLDLLNNLDKKSDDKQKEKDDARKAMAHSALMQESEFSSAVKSSVLTLDQLMSGITDTKGFGTVQKTMKGMTSNNVYDDDKRLTTTKAPVAKIVSDRVERKVNYQEQSEEVSGWVTVTKQNRQAETLDFRPKDRIKMSKDELVGKFEPTTEFEREVAAALEEAGAADEKEMAEKEDGEMPWDDEDDDDLGRHNLSPDEHNKRLGELKKMRALMFYEEQKRHHINKIKSKKYRKIRKKQKTRIQDSDEAEAAENSEEYARELEEKAEMERMKERMSLKHRNTSKWAKRVLRRGGNIDKDTRRALSEQVRIGDELKRKMNGYRSDDSEEDEMTLLDQAKSILADTEKADSDAKKGLFQLDFMKKGLEAQRERARKEARELLEELQANEEIASDDNNEMDFSEQPEESEDRKKTTKKKKKKTASAKEMEAVLQEGKMVVKSLEFGNSNAVSVAGAIDLNAGSEPKKGKVTASNNATTVSLSTIENMNDTGSDLLITKVKSTEAQETKKSTTVDESNPWMRSSTRNGDAEYNKKEGKQSKKVLPGVSKQGIINVNDAVNVISEKIAGEEESMANEATDETTKTDTSLKITKLTQEELVKKAFATVSEEDIEEEFEKEKDAMRGRDDHSKKLNAAPKQVSGWGSWAGEGAPPPRPPRKLPKHLEAPKKRVEKRIRKDDGKKNVIISAKRIKKNAKFQMENVPHPYSSREQYERAMSGAVGKEWHVSGAVKEMTRSKVLTRAGKMIRPITKKAKVKRAPLVKFKN